MAAQDGGESVRKKTNRPEDTAFRQQRLPAWKPVLTARSTLPSFLVLGAIFMVFGGVLYGSTQKGKEIEIDYTYCPSFSSSFPTATCAELRKNESRAIESCQCRHNFTLTENWSGEIFMYYKLTNFYQNHRRYVRSRNDQQLRGDVKTVDECSPLKYRTVGNITRPIAPCGLIANSLFNDTFVLRNEKNELVPLTSSGIAWSSDKKTKFRNPSGPSLEEAFKDTFPPPNWQSEVYNLSQDASNNGFVNEDFIVWMRTAALPTFRKLHRRIKNGLPKGTYSVLINYNFPTTAFDGRKSLVLLTISWMGGKNPFLGIAYLTVGSICVATSGALLALDRYKKHGGGRFSSPGI